MQITRMGRPGEGRGARRRQTTRTTHRRAERGGPGTREAGYSGAALTESLRPDHYVGHSMITSPAFPRFGRLVAEAGALEEIVVATVNLEQQDRFQKVFDYRRWRRGRLSSASRLIRDEFVALAEGTEEGDEKP